MVGSVKPGHIYCGDAADVMRSFPAKSVDLVVTSPPYNIKNSTGDGLKCGRYCCKRG